jgi:formiminotetrahydrofolate cyclodeaminase
VEADIQRMLAAATAARMRLLELVKEDADAFLPLSRAYAIPRDDPSRAETLEEVTKWACAAPMEMMRQTCQVIELLEEMGEKGSRMLLSDVGVGALLARAALEAASLNVFVNTRSLTNRAFAEITEAEADEMLKTYCPRAEALAASVMERVRG